MNAEAATPRIGDARQRSQDRPPIPEASSGAISMTRIWAGFYTAIESVVRCASSGIITAGRVAGLVTISERSSASRTKPQHRRRADATPHPPCDFLVWQFLQIS